MTKFIRLHLRRPRMKDEYRGNRYGVVRYQYGWYDDKIDEVFFNVDKIETFSDYKVNDIDVCETANEIIKELDNGQEKY